MPQTPSEMPRKAVGTAYEETLQKTHSLVRLRAALAIDVTTPTSHQSAVGFAPAPGASNDAIVGTLVATAPTVGLARVVASAPNLAPTLDDNPDAALEAPDRDGP